MNIFTMSPAGHPSATVPGASPAPARRDVPLHLRLLAGLWLAVIAVAMAWILHYSNTPGEAGAVPPVWPAGSAIAPDARQPTLLLFAHPRCPCTRATLGELARLLADCQGRVQAQVWFLQPAGAGADWTNAALPQAAAAIPGLAIHWDADGREAARFHAETSGQTMLYDARGQLLFQGGITISRGHEGDNPGRRVLTALLNGSGPATAGAPVRTPVFGCSLEDDQCPLPAGTGNPPKTPDHG